MPDLIPDNYAEWRDFVVIVYGAMGIFLMFALVVAAIGLWLAIRGLSRQVQQLLNDPIKPTLEELQRTAQNVRGTSEFMADTTVHPVIKAIAFTRGVRRGVGAVAGIRGRRSR